ncbi:ATP-binding protein [Streptomyces sp. NPDC092296]|uniref:ATP-binding protein n=1 Tax=Streptomyces sp. NPDC092296 TaxID=3366012 RepID=UPI0038234374
MPQTLPPEEQHQGALRWRAGYDGRPGTSAAARRFTAGFLEHVRSAAGAEVTAGTVETVQLVVSELVANVSKYAPGPCRLDLTITGDCVEVAVWDTEPALPRPRSHDALRIGQHGLEIVFAVSRHVRIVPGVGGKGVHARIALG